MPPLPEVWLRGPVAGVPSLLQPAAHALLQVREEIPPLVEQLSIDQLWARPGGAAAIGFHLLHFAGSTDRLLTYGRGQPLSVAQLRALEAERTVHEDRPALAGLVHGLTSGIDRAVAWFAEISPEDLSAPREVGRRQFPSTMLGLLFHAAEHGSRHAGQIVTLARVVRG